MLILGAVILLLTGTVGTGLGIALIVLATIIDTVEIWLWMKYLRRKRPAAGAEAMIGERAVVVEPLRPEGTVRLRGEIWSARCATGVEPGEKVTVVHVDGLTLEVE